MNITDVMRLVDWDFEIAMVDAPFKLSLVTPSLYAEFNKHSCEVTHLQVGSETLSDLDSVETFNRIAELIKSPATEELLSIDIDKGSLDLIDAAAAVKNLSRNQFILSSLINGIERLSQ